MKNENKKNVVVFIVLAVIINILGFMFFSALDKSYTNRAKNAGYLCAQCLTDAECEKFCSK